MALNVFPFQDNHLFHQVPTTTSRAKRGREPTLCGLSTATMRRAAPFAPLDPRGAVHFERGCSSCIDLLANYQEGDHGP